MRRYDAGVIARSQFLLTLAVFDGLAGVIVLVFSALALYAGYRAAVLPLLGLAGFLGLVGFLLLWFWPKQFYLGFGFTEPIQRKWRLACQAASLTAQDDKGNVVIPVLNSIGGTVADWSAVVVTSGHWTVNDLRHRTADIEAVFGKTILAFVLNERGAIVLRARRSDIPVIAAVVPPPPLLEKPRTHQDLVASVPVALCSELDAAGEQRTLYLSVTDNHILLVGASGGGKSSWIWSIVLGLGPAVRAGIVKLWACDPKLTELNKGREWWDVYACEPDEMVALIIRFYEDMKERAALLRERGDDHYVLSPDEPLHVLVVDELADLLSGVEKKKAEAALRPLTAILRLGRALGYVVVGASQSILKDAIPCKDDFITRVGLRMMTAAHVDMVLGAGMREAGALCWQIPYKTGVGMAYVIGEDGKPVLARAFHYDKKSIKAAVAVARSAPLRMVNTDKLPVVGAGAVLVGDVEQEVL